MGKAARLKRERSRAPATAPSAVSERTILLASAAFALVGVLVVGVLLMTRPSHEAPPPAPRSAAEDDAPAALARAADAVGFTPNVEPGTGEVERLPASAARPPSNPNLLSVSTRAPEFTLQTPEEKTVGSPTIAARPCLSSSSQRGARIARQRHRGCASCSRRFRRRSTHGFP